MQGAASPRLQTVATDGRLEYHLSLESLVIMLSRPVVPFVPIAMSCAVWVSVSAAEVGRIVTAVIVSAVPAVTVKVAVPFATVPVEALV